MAKKKNLTNEPRPTELSEEELESVTGGAIGAFECPVNQQFVCDFEHQNDTKIIENPTAPVKADTSVPLFPEKKPFIFKK